MKSRLRSGLEAALGLVVLGFAVVWLSGGCEERVPAGHARIEERGPAGSGRVVAALARTEASREWASGEVASARDTVVSSRVLARIEEILVRAGSRVSKGQVLLRLDARDLAAGLAEAKEALRAARARLELAESEFERVQGLFDRGVASRRQLDLATSELRGARAEVQRLEEARKQSEAVYSFAELRSPVDGRVIDRLAEPGDMALPGRPLLRIYDPSLLRVEVPVRESLAIGLRVGQELPIEIPSIGETWKGMVDEVVPFAEPGARTMLVKVRLIGSDERLIAGMYARVGIPAGERRRLVIPGEAIEEIGQLRFVDVVAPQGGLQRRLITVGGPESDGYREVLSGLEPGEEVWVPGAPEPAARAAEPEGPLANRSAAAHPIAFDAKEFR